MQGHAERLKQWVSVAVVLIIIAVILHFTDGKLPSLFGAFLATRTSQAIYVISFLN